MKLHTAVFSLTLAFSGAADAQMFIDDTFKALPKDAQSAMRAAMDDNFRDPEATKFKSLTFRSIEGEKNINGEPLQGFNVCGLVNAKNQQGGYEGYKKFTFSSQSKKFAIGGNFCK
ncbi:hypothetical protein ACRS7F_23015 [Brucella anthropi]|uniref:hypothetical protein n=1 Tax=Brucella anthropi TaxID=529 RepID=UPI003EE0B91C